MPQIELETICLKKIGNEFSSGILALGNDRFRKWILRRGMEFGSPWIWWGDIDKTREETYGGGPHEGVDFAIGVVSNEGLIEAETHGMRVPLFTAGTPIWCFQDLVGDTVIVATDVVVNDSVLIIQYSHIEFENAQLGKRYGMGTDIGKIKLSENPKSVTASHLHISTGLLKKSLLELSPDEVDFKNWLDWDTGGELIYIDPLALISEEVKERLFLMEEAGKSSLHSILCSGAEKEDRLGLRRLVARNFPGVRVLLKKSPEEGQEALHAKGLLAVLKGDEWKIHMGEGLASGVDIQLSGQGRSYLIESIRSIEAANARTTFLPA